MSVSTKKEKVQFWWKWTLINALALILGYIISVFVVLLINEIIFDNTVDEWGSPFEQTVVQIALGIVIGFSIGITQWRLLRKVFNVSSFWLYSVVIGFTILELIAGIILWKLDINRGELNFIEFNALAHALILAITGLIIGIIQMPLLKKQYAGSVYWVVASTLAWGISILITAIDQDFGLALLITFILGAILYGAITGATLMWILKPKEKKS
jgi:hypothetical protein